MADINVERRGPSIWPWILGLLVLALVIWGVAEMVDEDEPQVTEAESVEEPATMPAPTPVVEPAPEAARPSPEVEGAISPEATTPPEGTTVPEPRL